MSYKYKIWCEVCTLIWNYILIICYTPGEVRIHKVKSVYTMWRTGDIMWYLGFTYYIISSNLLNKTDSTSNNLISLHITWQVDIFLCITDQFILPVQTCHQIYRVLTRKSPRFTSCKLTLVHVTWLHLVYNRSIYSTRFYNQFYNLSAYQVSA